VLNSPARDILLSVSNTLLACVSFVSGGTVRLALMPSAPIAANVPSRMLVVKSGTPPNRGAPFVPTVTVTRLGVVVLDDMTRTTTPAKTIIATLSQRNHR